MKSVEQFNAEQLEQVMELKAQLVEQKRILENYKKEHGHLEVFFNSVLASVSAIDPLPIVYKPRAERGAANVEAVMQITDGHMGAVQELNEIEGFNEYNPKICHDRQIDFAERFCKFIDRQRLSYPIDVCNILVTGDLISGDIHQELQSLLGSLFKK